MARSGAESAARTLADLVPRLGRLISGALEADAAVALSLRQYRMLERLSERPHRTTDLAVSSGVTQPTASAAIGSLEARALVARQDDPRDRRATLIVLTDEGRIVLARARERVHERLLLVTRDMTEADAEVLRRLQPVLVQGMDRARDQLRRRASEAPGA